MLKVVTKKTEPKIYLLWTGIIGMSLTFVVLTLLYLLRKNQPDWTRFQLPSAFGFSTFFMIASSYTLYIANQAFKKEEFFTYRYFLGATFIFGLAFLISQYIGWLHLHEMNLPFIKGKASAGFLYVISGLHILHLVGGMVALLLILVQALRKISYVDSFVYSVNPPNQLRLKMVTIYWHFVDIVWLYLFVFFWINQWI